MFLHIGFVTEIIPIQIMHTLCLNRRFFGFYLNLELPNFHRDLELSTKK